MATIQQLKNGNNAAIRNKVTPNSISPKDVADRLDATAEELLVRGIVRVNDVDGLASTSKDNAKTVLVEENGLFKAFQTSTVPDYVETFPSASAGWVWKRVINVSAAISKIDLIVNEDSEFVLPDGYMCDKILMKPTAADTIRIGITDGGQEIKFDEELTVDIWTSVNYDLFADGADVTIYFTGITAETTILIYIRKL